MVMRDNWWDGEFDNSLRGATAEQIGRALGNSEQVLDAIQGELDRQVPAGTAGPSLSQRIGRAVAEVITAR
jgi:hypothetical protein